MGVSCAALLCVRNEASHLPRALAQFIDDDIDVAVIDHGSSDGSLAICERHLGRGVVAIDHLPWLGVYDQTAQLQAKAALAGRLSHDWLIHADADEWMHTQRPGESLRAGITRADAQGCNAINFEEFVFLPGPGDHPLSDVRLSLGYYFFAPSANRLMRAWRRNDGLENISSGGHVLAGEGLRLFPEAFVLRHYIVLSQRQAIEKYAGRVFAQGDLDRGWHGNRLGLSERDLKLPDPARLRRLPDWTSTDFDRTDPQRLHFWHWPASQRGAVPIADA